MPKAVQRAYPLARVWTGVGLAAERRGCRTGETPDGLAKRLEIAPNWRDGARYDIQFFEEDGRDRLIGVKPTRFAALTPFFPEFLKSPHS